MKEIWKDINGYNGMYQVSNLGNIKSFKRNRESLLVQRIKGKPKKLKYNEVGLSKNNKKKSFYVHRLVLTHFDRLPLSGEECNHIDRNPLNNRIDNLEWCTSKQNSQHSRDNHIRANRGGSHPRAKLSDKDALKLKRLKKQGVTHKKLSEMFNITIQHSQNMVCRGYKHLDHLIEEN